MNHDGTRLVHSATDVSSFIGCQHLTLLSRRTALGGPKPPQYYDPSLELLWRRGLEHEEAFLGRLEQAGRSVVRLEEPDDDRHRPDRWARYAEQTVAAMRTGADVIYQGCLFDGTWLGKADFLLRVERPSRLGAWSYEVLDTKLAREAKGGALLQVLLYAELLAAVQGTVPEHVHIALGGPEARTDSFRVADYAAYFRSVRTRLLEHVANAPAELATAVEPVEHCRVCAWRPVCEGERRAADHLSLVAGITSSQRRALQQHDVRTLEALAMLPSPQPSLDGISRPSLERIHNQARIQLEGRRRGANVHELLQPVVIGQGLAALPEPSPGDLFFDLEGDPYALIEGIEYLFGFTDAEGNYTAWWAFDRASEKHAFERFIDTVMQRLEQHPGLHIYHYNHYETTAIRKLMGRYGTREEQVDRLLRGGVFDDLYRVVRQGLRASVESYSIKKMEPFYGYDRDVDLADARSALAQIEAWLEMGGGGDPDVLARIEGYNRDDCVSTLRLHQWLESLRQQLATEIGAAVPRPEPQSGDPSEAVAEQDARVAALVAQLTEGVPADEAVRTAGEHGRWLLAQLLEFHRREKRGFWRDHFTWRKLSLDELIEDRATLGGLEYAGEAGVVKRSILHRYRFPPQEHRLRLAKGVADTATGSSPGTLEEIDDVAGTLILKRGATSAVPHPAGLMPYDHVDDKSQRESLMRLGEAVASTGVERTDAFSSAADLLLRRPPRVAGNEVVGVCALEDVVEAAVRLATRLRGTVLPIQGPPGAGKTYTAARMIVAALQAGKRVGVTAQSHEVIGNLLREVRHAGEQIGLAVEGIQKATEDQWCGVAGIPAEGANDVVRDALRSGTVSLAAGTAWLWSREDMAASVDLLFIDEAGQFSLANALAVAPAADSLVLVGDPQQLEQPIQGSHPPGVHVSALEHLLGGAATVAAGCGLFLGETWRLHPTICSYTSELFYDGKLTPRRGLELQEVRSGGLLHGSGLRFMAVPHEGNQNTSPEEVDIIAELVEGLLGGSSTWIDGDGMERPMGMGDILIVAPYNAHVAAISARVPDGVRVGTVDKFQGKQAPVVIYSMATSTAADAPRGMGFLYSPNRLNVATSRARCLAVVVASPALFTPDCRTPAQMRLANAFCRFFELSEPSAFAVADGIRVDRPAAYPTE
jgi:predicted RecB family nuclease